MNTAFLTVFQSEKVWNFYQSEKVRGFFQSVKVWALPEILVCVSLVVLTALFVSLSAGKYVNVLQQSSYKIKGLKTWLKRGGKEYKADEIITFFLAFAACCLAYFCLLSVVGLKRYFCVVPLFVCVPLYLRRIFSQKPKKKLEVTNRVKKIFAACFIISFVVLSFALLLVKELLYSAFDSRLSGAEVLVCPLLPAFTAEIVMLAEIITSPLINAKNAKFVKRAKQKLHSLDGVIKIGVTGSYGKTTVKNILYTVLSTKYKVLKTPESFNTPLGIAKTVENLDSSYDVFIAEMGARKRGDIKELCEIVPIDYAVLTGVAEQHLETFGDVGEIKKEKTEILRALSKGVAVVGVDCPMTATIDCGSVKPGVKLLKAGTDSRFNPDITCENIRIYEWGSEFTLSVDGEKARTKTKLLGKHFITDILLAAGIAYSLGFSVAEIAAAVSIIEPIKHRMELIDCGEYFVIDDGYNSNPAGAKEALETLGVFSGTKILVTPGIVEAGKAEKSINFSFGIEAAKHCDYVILVESPVTDYIKEGVLSAKKEKEKVFVVGSLDEAKILLPTLLSNDGVVLFENDLPDAYL